MSRRERLKEWIKTLNEEQKDKIILELTDFAIDAEEVSFYESTKAPYWDNSGDRLDGLELEDEED